MNDEIAPKVERLVDLVSYQEGAVVSRTILDKDAGTVTLFAFDAGEGLSEHTTPYDAMVNILDGKAEIKIGSEPFHLGEVDIATLARTPTVVEGGHDSSHCKPGGNEIGVCPSYR